MPAQAIHDRYHESPHHRLGTTCVKIQQGDKVRLVPFVHVRNSPYVTKCRVHEQAIRAPRPGPWSLFIYTVYREHSHLFTAELKVTKSNLRPNSKTLRKNALVTLHDSSSCCSRTRTWSVEKKSWSRLKKIAKAGRRAELITAIASSGSCRSIPARNSCDNCANHECVLHRQYWS